MLMVCFHVLELLFDESALPRGIGVRFISLVHTQHFRYMFVCTYIHNVFHCVFFLLQDPHLGLASFSVFGSLGATVQVVLFLYPFFTVLMYFFNQNDLLVTCEHLSM